MRDIISVINSTSQALSRHSRCQLAVVLFKHQHTCTHLLRLCVNVSSRKQFLRSVFVPQTVQRSALTHAVCQ